MAKKNLFERGAGILMHPTSLYNKFGIGDLGPSCFEFIDFLANSKQKFWQVLPLNPINFTNSPYQSCSAFAGNDLLISPEILCKKKYLAEKDLNNIFEFAERKIDYKRVREFKSNLFLIAYKNFKLDKKIEKKFNEFKKRNKDWLNDYALFCALKKYFIKKNKSQEMAWNLWPKEIMLREAETLKKYEKELADEINYQKFLQFEFYEEWCEIKKYANERKISVIGDIPIFVAYDSADVWANKNLFKLNKNNNYLPKFIAGVPPDNFAINGQLWGNPVYDWQESQEENYKWWLKRIKKSLDLFDIIRIDHFRGFESYWQVKFGEETAVNGEWIKGPGKNFFDYIKKKLGDIKIIAEDLGIITDEVKNLRDTCGFPGMRVLQFAFDYDNQNEHLPHNFCVNVIGYTGTHDNNTTVGWYKNTDERIKDRFRRYMNVSGEDVAWDLIRLLYSSVANCVIVPVQDLMSLDELDRMNVPGEAIGNWEFRFKKEMLLNNNGIRERLIYLCDMFNR